MRRRCQPKRLPHVHHRQPNARALRAEPGVELAHACLRTVLAAKPDRPAPQQIAHHNPIGVTLTDRDLVNANHLAVKACRHASAGLPIYCWSSAFTVCQSTLQFRRHVLDRRRAAATADIIGKALGVERIAPPESRAARASPCHSDGSRGAAPPIPEKSSVSPRTTDRAPAVVCDRTSPSGRDRNSRKPFF